MRPNFSRRQMLAGFIISLLSLFGWKPAKALAGCSAPAIPINTTWTYTYDATAIAAITSNLADSTTYEYDREGNFIRVVE